jgi:hypothetical protein
MGFFAYYLFVNWFKNIPIKWDLQQQGGETASTGIKKLGLHTEGLPAR